MSSSDRRPHPISDAALIDAETIRTVLQNRADDPEDSPFEVLRAEPALSSFVHGELLKLFGKLALSGASTEVIRGVSTDVHHLLGVTAGAFRLAYCDLLEDFLPDGEPDSESDETPPPENDESQMDGDANIPF
jgi:hypothetical protein